MTVFAHQITSYFQGPESPPSDISYASRRLGLLTSFLPPFAASEWPKQSFSAFIYMTIIFPLTLQYVLRFHF
jgi:hypothetical protein